MEESDILAIADTELIIQELIRRFPAGIVFGAISVSGVTDGGCRKPVEFMRIGGLHSINRGILMSLSELLDEDMLSYAGSEDDDPEERN